MRYLYLGRSSTGLIKIGIATNLRTRWNDIDRSTPGSKERPTFAVRILAARSVEQTLHRLFWLFRVRHRGSGKTEWFRFPFPLDWIAVTLTVTLLLICRIVSVALVWSLVLSGTALAAYVLLK